MEEGAAPGQGSGPARHLRLRVSNGGRETRQIARNQPCAYGGSPPCLFAPPDRRHRPEIGILSSVPGRIRSPSTYGTN